MPNGDNSELWKQLNDFRNEYERRHGEILGRISRLEEQRLNVATREDLEKLKSELIESFRDTIVTARTDLDWLKRAFWFMAGVGATIATGVIGGGIAHIAGKI